MKTTKNVNGRCQHCDGLIEFPAEDTGSQAPCPLCGQTTELRLAVATPRAAIPANGIIFSAIAIVILIGGLVAAQLAITRARKLAGSSDTMTTPTVQPRAPKPADPFAAAGFANAEVTLERTPASSLVYAVGTITNLTDRRRFGVRLTLDLFDRDGQKIGSAKDYRASMEPHDIWQFKALAVEARTTSARLVTITEEQ